MKSFAVHALTVAIAGAVALLAASNHEALEPAQEKIAFQERQVPQDFIAELYSLKLRHENSDADQRRVISQRVAVSTIGVNLEKLPPCLADWVRAMKVEYSFNTSVANLYLNSVEM